MTRVSTLEIFSGESFCFFLSAERKKKSALFAQPKRVRAAELFSHFAVRVGKRERRGEERGGEGHPTIGAYKCHLVGNASGAAPDGDGARNEGQDAADAARREREREETGEKRARTWVTHGAEEKMRICRLLRAHNDHGCDYVQLPAERLRGGDR